jgi:hypothetical protein
MTALRSKNLQLLWGVWILFLGISLFLVHTIHYVDSFSEYLRAFMVMDMPSSWCPTFLTLYGITVPTAQLLGNSRLKEWTTITGRVAGLILLPIGIYATYEFTLNEPLTFDFIYIYAQTIHISETLTGLLTIFHIYTFDFKRR